MFEYLTVNCTGNIVPIETLNELGAEKWELVTIHAFVAYFKRPKRKPRVKRANGS